MKTILLVAYGRERKYKQRGLATADNAALSIYDYRKMAQERRGKFAIVDAEDVEHARKKIILGTPTLVLDDGRTLVFGEQAARAVSGSESSIAQWDERIKTQGKVYLKQARAL